MYDPEPEPDPDPDPDPDAVSVAVPVLELQLAVVPEVEASSPVMASWDNLGRVAPLNLFFCRAISYSLRSDNFSVIFCRSRFSIFRTNFRAWIRKQLCEESYV